MENLLEKELKYFHGIQDTLQRDYPNGGFAVIKDCELIGVWANRLDGIQEGAAIFGNVPFLVKDILEHPSNFINYSRPIKLTNAVSYH